MKIKERLYQLLRWSGRYIGTDMIYVFERGSWVFLSQLSVAVIALTATVVLANILPKEVFGQYRFILSMLPILAIFTLPSVGTSMIRSVARGNKVNFKRITRVRIGWGMISSAIALLAAAYYFYRGNQVIAYALVLSAAFLPVYETYYIYSFYYKGRKDFKTASIYEIISRLVQSAVIVFVAIWNQSLIPILAAFFIGKLALNYFFYRKTKISGGDQITMDDAPTDKSDDTIPYAKHLSAVFLLGVITDNIDKLFVWHYFSAEEVAVYYIALVIPWNVILMVNVLSRIALPKLSANMWAASDYRRTTKRLMRLFVVLIPIAIIYALFVPFVINFLFVGYSASVTMALMFAPLIPIFAVNSMLMQVLRATKSVSKIMTLRLLAIALFIGIFMLTYAEFGVVAVAAAFILSEGAALMVGLLILRRFGR